MYNLSSHEFCFQESTRLGWKWDPPSTYHYYSFEERDIFFWHDFIKSRYYYAIYASVAYLITIFGLQEWMKSRPAFQLKIPLFWWNLSLGVFSIAGLVRTIPTFVNIASKPDSFYNSICTRTQMTIPMAFWALCFSLSKFVELGDTVFLVLRKKPLIFLQWYHHVITMCAVWILVPYGEPVTRWFAVLNFGVHSLMYPYFAFKSIGMKIPSFVANIITTLQAAQMVFGLAVNLISMHYYNTASDCFRHPISIQVFTLLYGSFFVLFGKLFYDSVILGGRKRRGQQKKTD